MGRHTDSESESSYRHKKKKKRQSRSPSCNSDSSSRKSKKKKSKKSKSHRRSRSRSQSRRSRSPSLKYRRSRSRSRTRSGRSSYDRLKRSRSRSYERRRRSRSSSYSRTKRSRSRSYERLKYRSRSRSRSRRRSRSTDSKRRRSRSTDSRRRRSRSHSRLRRSRSSSRGRRKRSVSPGARINDDKSSDPASSIPGYEDMTPAEKAEARMRMALKAAAVADEKIKAMSGETSSTQPAALTFEEQRSRAKAIDEIESAGFAPAAFTSSRLQIKQEPGVASSEVSHEAAMFGHGQTSNVNGAVVKTEEGREGIMHPNLYVSEDDKMQNWVRKLAQMRKKKLEGDAMA